MSDSLYQSAGAKKCAEPTGQCENLDVNGYCEKVFNPPCLWDLPSETPIGVHRGRRMDEV